MPDFAYWAYGTILVNRRARIMFLGWDKERQRMLGGGQPWFKAMKLDGTRFVSYATEDEVGEIANFTPYGWQVEGIAALTRKALVNMPTEEFRALVINEMLK